MEGISYYDIAKYYIQSMNQPGKQDKLSGVKEKEEGLYKPKKVTNSKNIETKEIEN